MKLVNFEVVLLKIDFLFFNFFVFFCGIVGVFVGVLVGLVLFLNDEKMKDFLIGFILGFMFGLICFGFIFEVVSILNLFLCILVLIVLYFLIGILERVLIMKYLFLQNRYFKSGIFILVVFFFYNFFEGLVIGSSFVVEKSFGILVGIMIIIYDILEGFVFLLFLKMVK